MTEHVDTLIVGGGQSGLALSYHLKNTRHSHVVLERSPNVGDVWRRRWDSLVLFTPARYGGLPGLPFPGEADHLPTKNDVADYLERYADHFELPVRRGCAVNSVTSSASGFLVDVGGQGAFETRNVVVATGPFQQAAVPTFASQLPGHIVQVHSAEYRNPAQLGDGPVLVVGTQASGCQIAEELSRDRMVYVARGKRGIISSVPRRLLGKDPFWWAECIGFMRISVQNPIGRWLATQPEPLIGTGPRSLRQQGVRFVPRIVGVRRGEPLMADGSTVTVSGIVWATGYRPDFSWIDAPAFDAHGMPVHRRGVSRVAGLYFLGLSWMHTRGSALLGWIGDDAAFLADRIVSTQGAPAPGPSVG